MKGLIPLSSLVLVVLSAGMGSCRTSAAGRGTEGGEHYFTIAFGSCNKPDLPNVLWDDVIQAEPDLWIWGGDIIYADTADVATIASMYEAQNNVPGYRELRSRVPVIGCWDDHDYGLNDGGAEWHLKDASQSAFLDFLQVPVGSNRRDQRGIYSQHNFSFPNGEVKIFVLDTRYFRSPLIPDPSGEKRYLPNPAEEAVILGEQQW